MDELTVKRKEIEQRAEIEWTKNLLFKTSDLIETLNEKKDVQKMRRTFAVKMFAAQTCHYIVFLVMLLIGWLIL
jgi:hypothetical protein